MKGLEGISASFLKAASISNQSRIVKGFQNDHVICVPRLPPTNLGTGGSGPSKVALYARHVGQAARFGAAEMRVLGIYNRHIRKKQ